jgi:replicative DNA helicase
VGELIAISTRRQTHELEDAVLGAVLALEDRLDVMDAMGLQHEDFENPRASIAYRVIRRLSERRLQVTALTVVSAGKNANLLSDGDVEWLMGVENANALTRDGALQLAEDIRSRAQQRRTVLQLRVLADRLERASFQPARTAAELESMAQALQLGFGEDETADSDLLAMNAAWGVNADAGRSTLDPTGIRVLDSIIAGVPENYWCIHGKPGSGKNIVLSTMTLAQLQQDEHSEAPSKTGVFLLEDGMDGMLRRWQAQFIGIPLREIGWRRLSKEEQDKKDAADLRLFPITQRIVSYRHDNISRAELARRIMRMIFKHGCRRIVIDNMKEIDHRDPRAKTDYWMNVAETTKVLRNIAKRTGTPIGMAVHDTEETAKDGKEGPSDPRKMTGGQAGGDRARLVVSTWMKGHALRLTVTKSTELSSAGLRGPTVELDRYYEAGTANPDGGHVVDLKNEAATERRDAREAAREVKLEESLAYAALRKKKLEQAGLVEKPAEPEAQGALDLGAT